MEYSEDDPEYYMVENYMNKNKDYICDIENVDIIYTRFCEFLETLNAAEKNYFIRRLQLSQDAERYSTFPYTDEEYEEMKEADGMFVEFLTDYLDENPDLEIYRDEIINMRFDVTLYYRGTKIFDNTNSIVYLK